MNLDDFEDDIDSSVILQRGHAYYRDKCVLSLEMTHTNHYEADVAGSQLYAVTVTLDDDREVEDIACTCPYDWGGYCKHEVAVLYSLRHQLNSTPHTLVARPKEVDLASLLEKKSKKELLSFLLSYARKSPELASALVVAFPSPDGEVNLTNLGIEFRQACEDGIESPEDDEDGWDDEEYGWQFSPTFRKKITAFLMMARSAIQEGDIRYGGSIATMMAHELSALDEYEDEDETLTDEVEGVLSEIAALFDDSTIRLDDGSWLFTQFLPEAKQYKGTLQAVLLSLCLRFAETEGDQKVLRDYLVSLVSDGTQLEGQVNHTILTSLELQHALLIKQGRAEDAQAFALDNLSYEAMRKLAFDYALGAKDYDLAEKLAKEKEVSAYTPRGGMDWSVLLFNVYQASGNREKVRELAKMFLLHDRLD
ncbi:MAG: SWIM zinc finger family protein, partial [Sphaerochaeta sp.]